MSPQELATLNTHCDREFSPAHVLFAGGTQGLDYYTFDRAKSWKDRKEAAPDANAEICATLTSIKEKESLDAVIPQSDPFPVLPEKKFTSPTTNCTFLASKKWEGIVLSVGETTFLARLTSFPNKNTVEEEAELPISDVTDDDKELLHEGAFFFFSVGYMTRPYGTRERSSRIRFRRLPEWTPDDILDANIRAKNILKNLGAE